MSSEGIGSYEARSILARFDKPDATDMRVPPVRGAYASFNDIALPIRRGFDSCNIMLGSMFPHCRGSLFPFPNRKAESLEKKRLCAVRGDEYRKASNRRLFPELSPPARNRAASWRIPAKIYHPPLTSIAHDQEGIQLTWPGQQRSALDVLAGPC
jgi:hypothetical protein